MKEIMLPFRYSYILANNAATAANGVYMKKKLDAKVSKGKRGMNYYEM